MRPRTPGRPRPSQEEATAARALPAVALAAGVRHDDDNNAAAYTQLDNAPRPPTTLHSRCYATPVRRVRCARQRQTATQKPPANLPCLVRARLTAQSGSPTTLGRLCSRGTAAEGKRILCAKSAARESWLASVCVPRAQKRRQICRALCVRGSRREHPSTRRL
ncbi:hypothetical protein C8R43DRAFT_1053421 [Mycena crocata]|nr:hypothetical protein C8R43DRAFT_1053421 [Mycena crocata]